MTDNRIYQSIESAKQQGETGVFKPVSGGQNTPPAAVPGRAFDLLSVEMPEVLGVTSQQIGGIPVNRG
jgi:hypothetical protein